MHPTSIDINCDLGESYGHARVGQDERLMPFVSSANIACGFHGGDPGTIHRTVRNAQVCGVSIGAHPSYPDLAGFGRRRMDMSPQEVYDCMLYQMGALSGFVRAAGGVMKHVKPHGALYNQAVVEPVLAEAIVHAVYYFDQSLMLFGPAGSALESAALKTGLMFCREVFADRTYLPNGSLTPRSSHGSVISEVSVSLQQVDDILLRGYVTCVDGTRIPMEADTICVHGDGSDAFEILSSLRRHLSDLGIEINPPKNR
jgi:5-oxoprolinase (ATP-hydrolysing) subunit A